MLPPIDFDAVVRDIANTNPRRIPWIELEQLGAHPAKIYEASMRAGNMRLAQLAMAASKRSALRVKKAGRIDWWMVSK
jgi:hypothetical protein